MPCSEVRPGHAGPQRFSFAPKIRQDIPEIFSIPSRQCGRHTFVIGRPAHLPHDRPPALGQFAEGMAHFSSGRAKAEGRPGVVIRGNIAFITDPPLVKQRRSIANARAIPEEMRTSENIERGNTDMREMTRRTRVPSRRSVASDCRGDRMCASCRDCFAAPSRLNEQRDQPRHDQRAGHEQK
jgi:hypothetical protein